MSAAQWHQHSLEDHAAYPPTRIGRFTRLRRHDRQLRWPAPGPSGTDRAPALTRPTARAAGDDGDLRAAAARVPAGRQSACPVDQFPRAMAPAVKLRTGPIV